MLYNQRLKAIDLLDEKQCLTTTSFHVSKNMVAKLRKSWLFNELINTKFLYKEKTRLRSIFSHSQTYSPNR